MSNEIDHDLLSKIVNKRCKDEIKLTTELKDHIISRQGCIRLCDIISNELAEEGFDLEYNPTAYGLKLEDLIDAIIRDAPKI